MTKKLNLVIVALSSLTVVSLAGSALSTLAWYAYSTRATMAYSGTAVRRTEQLQIGLLWDDAADSEFTDTYGTEELETIDGHSYYFMPAGMGFVASAINYYLGQKGFATYELPPLTSTAYADAFNDSDPANIIYNTNALSLYESPSYSYAATNTPAIASHYVKLPFVFRIISMAGGTQSYAQDQKIWLTDATCEAREGDVAKAIRLYVDNKATGDKFILNPTSEESDTQLKTYVGGVLDLNGDGYYDSDNLGNEILYGTASGSLVPFDSDVSGSSAAINGTDTMATAAAYGHEHTTFYAKHRGGGWGYNAYASRGYASYTNFAHVKPVDTLGTFSGGRPFAITGSDVNALARVDLTVYLEGWDHAVIDDEINHAFNLGLQFEINRV